MSQSCRFRLRNKLPMANQMDCPCHHVTLATSRQHHVGHAGVRLAVKLLGYRAGAEAKTGILGIATRPAAGVWFERPDFFGEGGRLFRCRLDEAGSRRLRSGTTVSDGDSDDGLLGLGDCYRLRS
jgi:hypothetical protein